MNKFQKKDLNKTSPIEHKEVGIPEIPQNNTASNQNTKNDRNAGFIFDDPEPAKASTKIEIPEIKNESKKSNNSMNEMFKNGKTLKMNSLKDSDDENKEKSLQEQKMLLSNLGATNITEY